MSAEPFTPSEDAVEAAARAMEPFAFHETSRPDLIEGMAAYRKEAMDKARLALTGGGQIIAARAWGRGFTDACYQHQIQRSNPEHPITRTNPYKVTLP